MKLFGYPVVPAQQRDQQIKAARELNLPPVTERGGRLAIVGSSHSLPAYEETLRRWPGEIWAVNGAFPWLKDRGIKAAFFTVHPTGSILQHMEKLDADDTAILASQCCPEAFEAAKHCTRYIYDDWESGATVSATQAAYLGVQSGFTEITFFGSDLNFSEGKQHVAHENGYRPLMVVRCNGEDYMTTPAYLAQAREIRSLIQLAPKIFRERSAGLLRAMIESEEDILWASDDVMNLRDPDLDALNLEFIVVDNVIQAVQRDAA